MRVQAPRYLRHSIKVYSFVAGVSLAVSQTALAEYRLAPGDTVEVAVAGIPDQRYRALVQLDGSISLPGVGPVVIEGMTQAALQARMETLLPTKIIRYRTPDGQERSVVLKPADVTASIAEYRPVYISGDVLTPGQQAYRPLMTVRQLVAVAGGYSMLRSRAMQAGADPVELQRDYEAASVEYAKDFFHAVRLQAELQNKTAFQPQTPLGASVESAISSAMIKSETESLRIAQDDFRAEQAFLEDSIKKGGVQLEVLKTQEQEEAKGVESDAQDLDRVGKLFNSGTVISPRLTEARRALLLSSTRHLQTSVEVMRLQRQQDDQRRQLERLEAQRKVKLLAELNDTNVRLAVLSARLHATGQRLQPLGAGGPVPAGADNLKPDVVIMRKVEQKWTRIGAAPDAEVEPGDVVEVVLRAEVLPSQ
ncbi:polysaccharide biosynthesis/export family protein [Bradyrhizobium erythrophlei]|jgi:polysaccharide export outer membrane protein|uniref:Polysaccharide export outer membrane protein n=1 Tax=Bradyrhizobium erythrophlei TaxID=1437360 RepID=A0A1M5JRM8_9BRAD|nr:polysaccharide biosynthesis/export family protein [Bradyrhizobium erythrophlei]SHG43178.1 polysaccharide export outer membrane protein [Bradyrhizobium erythrophlei]